MTSLLTRPAEAASGAGRWRAFRRSRVFAPVAVGALAFVFLGAFSWIPSPWYDEAATISAADRTVPQLFAMLRNVDAVHGAYYLLMHGWFELVGYTPFTLRLPSTVATAVAAGLLVVLVRRMASDRTAVLAGVVFCLLPRVTWMATEGRSYAITALLAVALTLVFHVAQGWGGRLRRRRLLIWAAYGILAAVACTVFIYLALLVLAHGVSAALLAVRTRDDGDPASAGSTGRRTLVGWLCAASAAGLAVTPLLLEAAAQAGQVQWIKPLGVGVLLSIESGQWALGNIPFGAFMWLGIVVGTVTLVRRRSSELLAVVLPWLLVPMLILLVESAVATPLYSARYLTFGAPAAAVMMAVAIGEFRRRRTVLLTLALLLAITLPTWVIQRVPNAKQESTWGQVASVIASERAAEPTGQRDAVVYGPLRKHPDADMAMLSLAYPREFAGLIDLKLDQTGAEHGSLWETRIPLADAHQRVNGVAAIWLVTSDKRDWRPSVGAQATAWGYRVDAQWHFDGVTLVRYVRR